MNKAAKKTVSFILSVLFLFSVMPVGTAYASETGNTSLVSEGEADSRTIAAVTVSKMPNKTSYVEGLEQLDVTGGQIMVNYEDGLSEAIDMTLEMVTGFDNTCVGVQTLTVTYSGCTATFEVEIMQKSLQSIAVTTMPDKQTYVEGMDALDVTGGKVTAYYNNETSQVIDLTPEMVSGFDNTKPGPQCLTVTYQDKTTTFYVEIESDERIQHEVGEKALISISVSKEPHQTVYLKDVETLDVSGGKINLHYDDGSVEEIDMTPEMISGFDHTQAGRQTLTVTYGTQTTKFNVDICENNTTEFAGGIGTETYPYIIRTAEQLDHVRRYPAAHFELQSDIIFTEDSPDWKPIGYNTEEMFKGVFDGNGHTICNLGINATDDDAYYVGLFGIVWGGTIKNLGVLDSNISAATYDLDYVGSIAGYVNDGTIINCYNTGTVTSDDIVGGIVGYATGSSTIENCHNTGTVKSADEAGGIVGSLSDAGNISNCYNSGAIMSADKAGGIAGSLSDAGSISNCYNAGTITSDNQAGGIAGSMQYGVAVTNCYNIGTVIGDSFSCGIVGYISGNGTITNCYYLDRLALGSYEGGETIRCTLEEMMSQNTFSGFDFEAVWTMGNEEYPLPVLQSSGIPTIPAEENASDFSDGQGTLFDPYIIETKEQLNCVRNHPWACFVLAENLTFDESDFAEGGAYYNEGAGWEPIGTVETPFYGVFDGNGHTIAGLQVDVADNSIAFAGLFGYVKNGQIKNLGLLDSQISATASNGDDSNAYAGGIAGRLVDDSLITDCYNTGAVTATAFSDHCPSSYAGGIAGLVENDSIVTNCYNTGAVTANASSTADFITTASAGGIGGYVFDGTITTCYNTGEVKAKASAKYSYNARAYLGGIAGMISYSGSTEKCYYLDNVSAGVGFGSGDATRCTWQEMTQQENFSGFDFETVWTMAGNENYLLPELQAVEMAKTTYLTSIELLTKPDKLEYQEGEDALDVTGGKIKLVYSNGMTLVVDLEAHMVTGFDNTVVGEQTLTVSYGGKETSYQITIVPASQPEEEIPTTVYDGVDYAAVYDYDYYHSHYPDLQDAFGDDDVAFLEHFVLCGMAEGRQASENFNVTAYRNRYPDLRKGFGNNLKSYYMHYVNYGKNEGRIATNCDQMIGYLTVYNGVDYAAVYDYNYYINLHPDLKKAYKWNEYALLQHFVEHGMNEGRQASKNFNVTAYRNRYPDLRKGFGNNLKSYYMHYVNNGKNEGRIATNCDQMIGYLTVYNGVDYAAVYDYNYYINLYPDLKKAYKWNENALLQHFVEHGMDEGRQASKNFNVYYYQRNYADLRSAFDNHLKSYYLHYMSNGRSEKRVANKLI